MWFIFYRPPPQTRHTFPTTLPSLSLGAPLPASARILLFSALAPPATRARILLCQSCFVPISIKQKCPAASSRNSQDSTRSPHNLFCLRVYFPWQDALQKGERSLQPAHASQRTGPWPPTKLSQRQRTHSQGKFFCIQPGLGVTQQERRETSNILWNSCKKASVLHFHSKRKSHGLHASISPAGLHSGRENRAWPQEFMPAVVQTTGRHTRTTCRAPPSRCQDGNEKC